MSAASFDIGTMITNLSNAFESIQALVYSLSYVIGLFFFMKGLMGFRSLANQTLASAQRGEVMGPAVHIFIGCLLVYVPSTETTSLATVFGTSSISSASQLIGYQSISAVQQWQDIADVIVKYTKLVGLIAFIRGWIILSKMGSSNAQPGSVGKGLIHVIGGVLLINIVDTFNLLACTMGYTGGSC